MRLRRIDRRQRVIPGRQRSEEEAAVAPGLGAEQVGEGSRRRLAGQLDHADAAARDRATLGIDEAARNLTAALQHAGPLLESAPFSIVNRALTAGREVAIPRHEAVDAGPEPDDLKASIGTARLGPRLRRARAVGLGLHDSTGDGMAVRVAHDS